MAKKGFQSPLLRRRAGILSVLDLDSYDSEVAQDLLALHDEIAMNPVRGYMPDYRTVEAQRRVWDYTLRALKFRLMPAVQVAMPKLDDATYKKVDKLTVDVTGKITLAEHKLRSTRSYEEAGRMLEQAFSLLHDAIEVIRDGTRKVPAARKIRPPVPEAYRDFS